MVASRPTAREAHEYLMTVKNAFKKKPEIYNTFLNVMKDFKFRRIGINGVITKVKDLFKGKEELLLGFNIFLPNGFKITLEDSKTPPKKSVTNDDAINYVNKVEARFQDDGGATFNAFFNLLCLYKNGNKSIDEVYNEVNILFQEHIDLCLEFYQLCPR